MHDYAIRLGKCYFWHSVSTAKQAAAVNLRQFAANVVYFHTHRQDHATAAPVGWWTWMARTLPQDAEAGGGLMVAVIQLAIALGSTVGGVLFDSSGYQSTFAVSAGLLLAAAILACLTARADPRP